MPRTMEAKMPAYRGERYEDTVPDTIDIAESARLAINALTGALDPNMDHELPFTRPDAPAEDILAMYEAAGGIR